MIDNTDQTLTVKNPAGAVEQLTGEQFVEWLMEYINHEVDNWPVAKVLAFGVSEKNKLRKFLIQRYFADQAFWGGSEGDPGFLGFAISNLSESNDPEAEYALEILERKLKEHQENPVRDKLWTEMIGFLGLENDEMEKTKVKEAVRVYIAEVSDLLSTQDWQTALGAIASYEWSWSQETRVISAAFEKIEGVSNKLLDLLKSLSNLTREIETGRLLDKIVVDPTDKEMVWSGASHQLEAKKQFLSQIGKYLK